MRLSGVIHIFDSPYYCYYGIYSSLLYKKREM